MIMSDDKQLAVVEPQTQLAAVIAAVTRAAADPSVDVTKMQAILDMQERILNRNAEAEFNAAMTAAQLGVGRVSTDATNPQTRSKYASYAQLDRAVRPVYTQHGFALSFDTGDAPEAEYVRVLCHVSHRGGHTRTYHADMPADGKGAKGGDVMTKTHATGSAMSYGMRYLLKMIFNVAIGEDDNDGNGVKPVITDKQAADLQALMDEVGADPVKFLKFMGVESVDDIAATDYDKAVKALERKRSAPTKKEKAA